MILIDFLSRHDVVLHVFEDVSIYPQLRLLPSDFRLETSDLKSAQFNQFIHDGLPPFLFRQDLFQDLYFTPCGDFA